MNPIIKLACLILVMLPVTSHATIYKSKDNQGNVVYSDKPDFGGDKVQLAPLHEFKALPAAPDNVGQEYNIQAIDVLAPWQYNHVVILQPKDEETFHSIGGVLPVEIEMQPRLFPGDELVVSVDGVASVRQADDTPLDMKGDDPTVPMRIGLTLHEVYRGKHTLTASVIRKGQVVAASQSVTIYVHQTTKLLGPKASKS